MDHRQTKASGRTLVVLGATALVVLLSGAFFAFRGIGRHRFERGSRMSEAHVHVAVLARGVAGCVERGTPESEAGTTLPPSTSLVPESVSALAGDGYTSALSDWQAPAFRCAGFAIGVPQRFQYRWERVTARFGMAEAASDADGDGAADSFFHAFVACKPKDSTQGGALDCVIGPVETTSWDEGRRQTPPP